jgi:hypothetical protein
MIIHPVGAKLFHVDGQRNRKTDMSRLTVLVCKFVNAPKKCFVYKIQEVWETEADGEAGLLDNKHVRGNISKAGGGGGEEEGGGGGEEEEEDGEGEEEEEEEKK